MPLDDDAAFELFRACAAEVLEVEAERIRLDAHLVDELEADSLDLLELALAIEEAFGIRLVQEDLKETETIGQAFELLSSKLRADGDLHVGT